jgi:Lon-like ATP-dependent protease
LQVLFICTANVKDTIPDPLRDRMDFIRLSGYVGQEKLHIVKQYIEPLERTRSGLTEKEAWVKDEAVDSLVRWYCREAGVRNLQKHIEKIYRKVPFSCLPVCLLF